MGPLHDKFRTTVIFIEHYLRRARVIFRKIQHDLRLGPAELINRLIVIPDNKEVFSGSASIRTISYCTGLMS